MVMIVGVSAPAWAASVTVPCEINFDNHAPFSDTWGWRVCTTDLPGIEPYAVLEITFEPITAVKPSTGWARTCHHGTPQRITLPSGLAATVATNDDGSTVTVTIINLRPTSSEVGTLTVGVECR